jgi:3-oxoacyl-[acyl-carrier-protein] synthase-3
MGTKILGVGAYLPSKVLTNYDLEKMVETSDEWITERTGIKERRIAENETVVEMALKAAEKAIEQAQIDKEEIELIILATLSPQLGFPATACLVQEALGLENNAMAFDISAACSGFLYGLDIADAYLKSQKKKNRPCNRGGKVIFHNRLERPQHLRSLRRRCGGRGCSL